jgi:hypothetical protein
MHAQHQDTHERAGPTPGLTPPVASSFPNAVTISDDDSVDSSAGGQHSELEGVFRDDYDDDGFVHIPQLPPAPNIVNEGAGPNIVPQGDTLVQAPEGAVVPPAPNIGRRTCSRARQDLQSCTSASSCYMDLWC